MVHYLHGQLGRLVSRDLVAPKARVGQAASRRSGHRVREPSDKQDWDRNLLSPGAGVDASMGPVKAAVGAIGGMLADQWKEFLSR